MNPFVEPSDAANVLAVAAYKVVQKWPKGALEEAVRELSGAVNYFLNARPTEPPDITQAGPERPIIPIQAEPPRRFIAALTITDPRAQNVAAFASSILSACNEIALERTMPVNDPAVRLLAAHLAFICHVDGDADLPALIRECHQRWKSWQRCS